MTKTPVKIKLPSLEVLKNRLDYDPSTGIFRWKQNMLNNKIKKGDIAGSKKGNYSRRSGKSIYLYIGVNRKLYAANRLAYYMYYEKDPYPLDVHHKNFDTLDNSITNLELLSGAENSSYKQSYINNTSGATGIRITPEGKFRATGFHKGKAFNLGTFKTKAKAIKAKKEFDNKKHHSNPLI